MKLETKLKIAIKSNNLTNVENIFEEIYYEYGKLVGFIISKYIDRREDIEELVDDVFVAFFKTIFKTEINSIKYYLVRIAKNTTINFLKSKANKLEIVYDEKYLDNCYLKNSTYYEIINELKKTLSIEEIDIILLHDVYNYTFDEISKKLDKPLFTITSIYRRAIKKTKGIKNGY